MTKSLGLPLALAAALGGGTAAFAQAVPGDAVHGASVVKQRCAACHAMTPGKNGIGPSLAGAAGRKAGSAAGFKYSPALVASGLIWTPKVLDAFLAAPTKTVPGTTMMIAVPAAADRADIIAYLAAQ